MVNESGFEGVGGEADVTSVARETRHSVLIQNEHHLKSHKCLTLKID